MGQTMGQIPRQASRNRTICHRFSHQSHKRRAGGGEGKKGIELVFRQLQHLADAGKHLTNLEALLRADRLSPGQSREPFSDQRRGVRYRARHTMPREQALQAVQADAGQYGHQKRLVFGNRGRRGDPIDLLGLDGQQLDGRRPDPRCFSAAGGLDRNTCKGPLSQTLCIGDSADNRQHLISRKSLAAQQWFHQGLGHAAQADHTEGRNHKTRTQRAVAPQAGDGAAAASCCCSASASRLTTVGVEASS